MELQVGVFASCTSARHYAGRIDQHQLIFSIVASGMSRAASQGSRLHINAVDVPPKAWADISPRKHLYAAGAKEDDQRKFLEAVGTTRSPPRADQPGGDRGNKRAIATQ